MATKKKAPAKKAAAPKPAAKKRNALAPIHKLVHAPNSANGALTEIFQHISNNPSDDLNHVVQLLSTGNSAGEKMEYLKAYLHDKV